MYAARYFPGDYFLRRYFPIGGKFAKPGYFLHNYFPRRYYADRYFPGHLNVVVAPPTPSLPSALGGGRPVLGRRFDEIGLVAQLALPELLLQALLSIRPAPVQALPEGPQPDAFRVSPAPVDVLLGQSLGLEMVSLLFVDRPRRKVQSTEDEDLLLLHYLLSMKDE